MEPSPFKSKPGLARLWAACRYTGQGLAAAVRHEAAFRQELALAIVLTPVSLLLPFSPIERALLIGSLLQVLIVELLNSAVEALVDRVSLAPHPLSGRAKDLGSAAVMVSLLLAAVTWVLVAGPAVLTWLEGHR